MTYFWRFFQKSQLFKWLVFKRVIIFKRWLVLKKLPIVINFNLSHQEIINMWPWDESFNLSLHHLSTSFNSFYRVFWFIFLHLSKTFLFKHFLFQEKFFVQKLVLYIFFILFSHCQNNIRTNRLNSFVSLFSLLPKESKD